MNKFLSNRKTVCLLLLAAVFLFLSVLAAKITNQVKALYFIAPISNLLVSPSPFDPSGDSDAAADEDFWDPPSLALMTISYNQTMDGFVTIKAYPCYEPEAPDEPPCSSVDYIDYSNPITISAGAFYEFAGPKIVTWAGMNPDKNIVGERDYLLEVMLYADPEHLSPMSLFPEQKVFNITYHLNQ